VYIDMHCVSKLRQNFGLETWF